MPLPSSPHCAPTMTVAGTAGVSQTSGDRAQTGGSNGSGGSGMGTGSGGIGSSGGRGGSGVGGVGTSCMTSSFPERASDTHHWDFGGPKFIRVKR